MPTWLIVVLCSIGAVALFVLAMSVTLMLKGRFMQSEISTNPHMKRLGIKCAVQETREADGSSACADPTAAGCAGNCAACDIPDERRDEGK